MSKELISPEGLRLDGRRPNEIRKLNFKIGLFSNADGSCYYEQGNTKIICAIYGPRECTIKSKSKQDRAIINCEYSMATFSTGERRKRKVDRRATEISLVIRQTFESVIMTSLFPKTQIDIFVQVLQADGGTRCACINAASLALIDAGIPMKDFVISCAGGFVSNTPLVDLNYMEDANGADIPIAFLPNFNKVTLLQMDNKLSIENFEKVCKAAENGCRQIYQILNDEIKKQIMSLAEKRGNIAIH
jgi:exosome complex component RRP41